MVVAWLKVAKEPPLSATDTSSSTSNLLSQRFVIISSDVHIPPRYATASADLVARRKEVDGDPLITSFAARGSSAALDDFQSVYNYSITE